MLTDVMLLLAFSELQSAHHCVHCHRRNHPPARRFMLRVLLLLQREGREQAQVSIAYYRHMQSSLPASVWHLHVLLLSMFRYERDMARLERQNEERKIKTDEKYVHNYNSLYALSTESGAVLMGAGRNFSKGWAKGSINVNAPFFVSAPYHFCTIWLSAPPPKKKN